MNKLKVYIAAALFLALTAFKLLFPAQMESLRRETLRIGATQRDYKAAVETIGRGLSDRALGEKLIAVFREYSEETAESGK